MMERRRRLALLLVTVTGAGILAAALLMATALGVRVFADDQSAVTKTWLLAFGTTAGACAGGWWAQPFLSRIAGLTESGNSLAHDTRRPDR